MKPTRSQVLNGRNARHILDRARNPERITLHAARRFIQDAGRHNDGTCKCELGAMREIREFCRAAKKIYRGKNSYILHSPPWWIFYRDDSIVTVMHNDSPRRF